MSHRAIYSIVGLVMAALLVVMLVSWDDSRDEAVAQEKATQLVAAFESAGIDHRLGAEQLADVFGDDGGAVCDTVRNIDENDAYRGQLKVLYSVGGEFYRRPTRLDGEVLARARLVVEVYCPDQLAAFDDHVDALETGDVVKD